MNNELSFKQRQREELLDVLTSITAPQGEAVQKTADEPPYFAVCGFGRRDRGALSAEVCRRNRTSVAYASAPAAVGGVCASEILQEYEH